MDSREIKDLILNSFSEISKSTTKKKKKLPDMGDNRYPCPLLISYFSEETASVPFLVL